MPNCFLVAVSFATANSIIDCDGFKQDIDIGQLDPNKHIDSGPTFLVAWHSDPSFEIESPLVLDLPDDVASCRAAIVEATEELSLLMLGPVQTVNWLRVFQNGNCYRFYG